MSPTTGFLIGLVEGGLIATLPMAFVWFVARRKDARRTGRVDHGKPGEPGYMGVIPFKDLGLTALSAAERQHLFLLADGETRAREQAGADDLPETTAYRALRDRFKQEQP